MPELPDIVVYIERLAALVLGRQIQQIRLVSPFFVRSFDPPLPTVHGKRILALKRLGKRIVFCLEDELYLVLHLMVAGRLHWRPPIAGIPGKIGLAAADFENGTLLVTEAGTKKRASLHLVRGDQSLARHNPGGIEVLDADLPSFRAALSRESHTLKRALTDPRIFSGIGNAYSDEILHRARLSPLKRTDQLKPQEAEQLFLAIREVLLNWTDRLRAAAGQGFPEKVTAFREGMAVHGRYKLPCPDCGSPVQRIVYAETETNYCARCQTRGRLLADRSLSRLLRDDWPRNLDEL
ncbi:MAG TPA: DNA-formamidopyrimidine glycosylase family protein [Acidobacteriota bacterium]|nr:DNA-formamidopyrimidine glycosylase family protein [Acidobacteriota bacterium]